MRKVSGMKAAAAGLMATAAGFFGGEKQADAALVQVHASGQVASVSDFGTTGLSAAAPAGSPVALTLIYDDAVSDTLPANTSSGIYPGAITNLTLSAGTLGATSSSGGIILSDSGASDQVQFNVVGGSVMGLNAGANFDVFQILSGIGPIIPNDQLSGAAPNFSALSSSAWTTGFSVTGATQNDNASINIRFNEITFTPVVTTPTPGIPEPALAGAALAIVGAAATRRPRRDLEM